MYTTPFLSWTRDPSTDKTGTHPGPTTSESTTQTEQDGDPSDHPTTSSDTDDSRHQTPRVGRWDRLLQDRRDLHGTADQP